MSDIDIHIPINIEDDNSSKSDDIERTDEKWSEKNESFLKNIKNDCLHRANQHDIISHRNKKRYIWTAIPAMVIPLVLANVSMLENDLKYIEPICLTCVSVINVFQTILNFSKKKEIHAVYSAKYAELATYIDKVLIRKKRYRSAFDVILERTTIMKQQLDSNAPYV